MIFGQFLPPLVTVYDATAANDIPLEEQIKLFKNLVFCQLVCRTWKEVIEDSPSLSFRDAHCVTEGGLAPRGGLKANGGRVKRLVVGEAKKTGCTSNSFLTLFPNVEYVSWICGISSNKYSCGLEVAHPFLKHLRRLDWRFCGDFKTSVNSFIKLVQHSPMLEYITLTEAEKSLEGGSGWEINFDIPDSVTTLGLFFRDSKRRLAWLIGSQLFTGPETSLRHVITSGSFRPRFCFSTIELRPDPCSTTKPAECALQNFLRDFLQNRLPQDECAKGTLIYSGAAYTPPFPYDHVVAERLKWVQKIVLKTSGSSHKTEDEKWDAARKHLEFMLKQFRHLKSVDLCGDFRKWRAEEEKGRVLEEFEKSARGSGISVEYRGRNP